MEKINLDIAGMHCGSCALGIEMLVSNLDGVKSISVSYDTKKAVLEFDSKEITQDQIFKSIGELGYQATLSVV
jgi:copper ion binding protein